MKTAVAFACICMLACAGQRSFAQDSARRFSVTISPALLVPVTVAVQVGMQTRLSRRCAFLLETAVPTFKPRNTEYEPTRSLRTGFEFKYCVKEKSNATTYIALQSSYLFRELVNRGQGRYYSRTQTFAYDEASIQSPVLALAAKWGTEIAAGRRIYVDAFAAAGVRMIFTRYEAKTALVTSLEPPRSGVFDYDASWRYNCTLTRLHVAAGVRFGWRL